MGSAEASGSPHRCPMEKLWGMFTVAPSCLKTPGPRTSIVTAVLYHAPTWRGQRGPLASGTSLQTLDSHTSLNPSVREASVSPWTLGGLWAHTVPGTEVRELGSSGNSRQNPRLSLPHITQNPQRNPPLPSTWGFSEPFHGGNVNDADPVENISVLLQKVKHSDSPGDPVVKMLHFQSRGRRFNPWWEN